MLIECNNNNFKENVLDKEELVIVDFYSTWCMPCGMLSPVLEKISKSRTECIIAKVNTDDSMEIAMKYRVSILPTLILFKKGKAIKRIEGFRSEKDILDIIEQYA